MLEPVSEKRSNFHVWYCLKYVLESKFQKPGLKITGWDTRIQRMVNMVFVNIHSTQVELVLFFLTGSILPQYHVVFD